MATTFSTTSNMPSSHVDAYIQKKLLEIGNVRLRFREYAVKKPLPEGEGKTVRFLRYNRLEIPIIPLTEGQDPADESLSNSYIEAVVKEYGKIVTLTNVLQLVVNHPVLQQAIMLVADAMQRSDDMLIQNALLAGTNVYFGNGKTSRGGLAATDYIVTNDLQKIIAGLDFTDGIAGGAPTFGNGAYAGILHRKHELDLQNDPIWKDMAIRQDAEALKRGVMNKWAGVEWKTTNFGPAITRVMTEGTAAATVFNVTAIDGGGSLTSSTAHYFTVTRKHKKRGFEEGISLEVSVTSAATSDNESYTVEMPTDTNYLYNTYFSLTSGAGKLVAENQEAGTVVTITALPTSGAAPPACPASGVTVHTSYVFGADSFAVVDFDKLEAGVTKDERTTDNPLKLRRKVGGRWMNVALVLNDLWVARLEAPTRF